MNARAARILPIKYVRCPIADQAFRNQQPLDAHPGLAGFAEALPPANDCSVRAPWCGVRVAHVVVACGSALMNVHALHETGSDPDSPTR